MNHHEAQVIADAYREQAIIVYGGFDDANPCKTMESLGFRTRSALIHDHAAVWQRVADALKPPTFVEVQRE